jgi:hypothetical protein
VLEECPSTSASPALDLDDLDDSGSPRPSKAVKSAAWAATGNFAEVTYWKYDNFVTDSDAVPHALRWFELSEALHA